MSGWRDDLLVAYRDFGLRVHEGPGWRGFGIGDWAVDDRPHAAIKHQFVWPVGNSDAGAVAMLTNGYDTGSYFLNPPVANAFLGKSDEGDVYMIGGRVAQHAGQGVRAVYDRAVADLPPLGDGQNAGVADDWSDGSFYYWGTEIHHYHLEAFHQFDALVRMGAAECEVFGWSANRILEHSNTTTRKREDLVALDGNRMRTAIAALLASPTSPSTDWFDMATDADLRAAVVAAIKAEIPALVTAAVHERLEFFLPRELNVLTDGQGNRAFNAPAGTDTTALDGMGIKGRSARDAKAAAVVAADIRTAVGAARTEVQAAAKAAAAAAARLETAIAAIGRAS